MRTTLLRRSLWSTLLAALLVFLYLAFRPQPVTVSVTTITRETVVESLVEEGITQVRDVYALSAPIAGRVLRVAPRVGDRVRAGETVLAELLPSAPAFLDARALTTARATVKAAEAAVALARAEMAKAEADLDYAALELTRALDLVRSDALSQAALDRARRQRRAAEAALASRRAEVARRIAELDMARAVLIDPATPETVAAGRETGVLALRAPVSGVVLSVQRRSETVVPAGTPLLEVGDPQALEVVVDLLSADAVRLQPGGAATITAWGGGRALAGTVRRIEPSAFTKVSALGVEEQRVNVIIDPNGTHSDWQALGHRYRVEVRLEIRRRPDVVAVPLAALFRQNRQWAVFVVDGKTARLRPVTLGVRGDRHAEIRDGLAPGERVIRYPGDAVRDGGRIRPEEFE